MCGWEPLACDGVRPDNPDAKQIIPLDSLRDATDERRVLLQLTAAGRALKSKALAVPESIACASGCSLDELAALTTRLKTLRRQLTASTTNQRAA